MYYTIQENGLLTADNKQALTRFYDNVLPLPEDYEVGKYVVKNGELVRNPNYETEKAKEEAMRIAQLSLTKREVFLAIYQDKTITPEQIRAQITDTEALIEFDYAEKYYRGNPLIDLLGASLGYTKEQLDDLFEFKSFAPVKASESDTGVLANDE